MKSQDEQKLEIILKMDESLLDASKLVEQYGFASNIRSRVVFMMKLWKDVHGKPHPRAKEFNL